MERASRLGVPLPIAIRMRRCRFCHGSNIGLNAESVIRATPKMSGIRIAAPLAPSNFYAGGNTG